MNIEGFVSVLGAAVLGIFGWAFQLNSRVSVLEAKHEDLITLINTRFDEMDRRLSRIEKAMNGRLHG